MPQPLELLSRRSLACLLWNDRMLSSPAAYRLAPQTYTFCLLENSIGCPIIFLTGSPEVHSEVIIKEDLISVLLGHGISQDILDTAQAVFEDCCLVISVPAEWDGSVYLGRSKQVFGYGNGGLYHKHRLLL